MPLFPTKGFRCSVCCKEYKLTWITKSKYKICVSEESTTYCTYLHYHFSCRFHQKCVLNCSNRNSNSLKAAQKGPAHLPVCTTALRMALSTFHDHIFFYTFFRVSIVISSRIWITLYTVIHGDQPGDLYLQSSSIVYIWDVTQNVCLEVPISLHWL